MNDQIFDLETQNFTHTARVMYSTVKRTMWEWDISPVSSDNSSSKPKRPKPEPKYNVSSEELMEDLECPVCLDLPIDLNILVCKRGHNVCEGCKKQLKTCGVCRSDFSEMRNYTAEAMIKKVMVECKNQRCKVQVRGADYAKHAEVCEYRPIRCVEKSASLACYGKMIDLMDYEEHLIREHQVDGDDLPVVHLSESSSNINHEGRWPVYYFRFDNQLFLRHIKVEDGILYWWVSLVGPEWKAKQYRVSLSISKENDPMKSIEWNHKVHSSQLEPIDVQKLADCASIATKVLVLYAYYTSQRKNVGNNGENQTVQFLTHYVIHKIGVASNDSQNFQFHSSEPGMYGSKIIA